MRGGDCWPIARVVNNLWNLENICGQLVFCGYVGFIWQNSLASCKVISVLLDWLCQMLRFEKPLTNLTWSYMLDHQHHNIMWLLFQKFHLSLQQFASVQIKLFTFLPSSLVVLQGIWKKSFCVFKLNQPQFAQCWSATMKSSYLIKI